MAAVGQQNYGNHTPAPTPHQDQLSNYCHARGLRQPQYTQISDRRGGRTAWSCQLILNGKTIPARFWYDGTNAGRAMEDAAETALQMLNVIPRTGVQPTPGQPSPPQQQPRGPYGGN